MLTKSIREEARERGVSKGKIFNERKAKEAIEKAGGEYWLVYAWRWSGDERYAKVGKSSIVWFEHNWKIRPRTHHPTDDTILLGTFTCESESSALALEDELLNETLCRVRPDREWVEIDETFNGVFGLNDDEV